MTAIKAIASAVLVAAAVFYIHAFCWRPFRCNQIAKSAKAAALAAYSSADPYQANSIARESARVAQRCIAETPYIVDLYMIAAIDHRILGKVAEASALYERALAYDRRPEIYFQLGVTQLELKRRAAAQRSFERAVLFDPSFIAEIPDPEMRAQLALR